MLSSQNSPQHLVSLRVLLLSLSTLPPPPQIDLGPRKLPVARPVCLLGLKPSPHRKWAVAALCVLDMVAQSLVLEADLEPSTTSEKQELAGIYETWLPVPLVGKDE